MVERRTGQQNRDSETAGPRRPRSPLPAHGPSRPGSPPPGLSVSGRVGGEAVTGSVVDDDGLYRAGLGDVENVVVGCDVLVEGSGLSVLEPEVARRGGRAYSRPEAG